MILRTILAFICAMGLTAGFAAACSAAEAEAGLSARERAIAKASAFASKGDQAGLRAALAEGLDAGVTVNEFKEILVQAYAYCVFPRSLNALNTFMALEQERGNKGAAGKAPSETPLGTSLEKGAENQTKLLGREAKGAIYEFAPAIDQYLKSHLFGDIFGRDNVDWKTREIATIAMLSAVPGLDSQLAAHIGTGKHNGVTDRQVEEILAISANEVNGYANTSPFPFGEENTAFAKYFSGKSWRQPLIANKELNVPISNITFEPGCRNNWHSHTGGQILIITGGVGYYQERGKTARRLVAGDVVEIPSNVEHWHGAAPDSWFSHLSVECNPQTNKNTWLEPVSDADYLAACEAEASPRSGR